MRELPVLLKEQGLQQRCDGGWKRPSTLCEAAAPSASLDHLEPWGAPTQRRLGSVEAGGRLSSPPSVAPMRGLLCSTTRCEKLQRSAGAMLQPFVRAAQLLKGGGKGKKGGALLGGLELSSEEAGLLNRNTQMLLRHLSPHGAPAPPPFAEQTGGEVDGLCIVPTKPKPVLNTFFLNVLKPETQRCST